MTPATQPPRLLLPVIGLWIAFAGPALAQPGPPSNSLAEPTTPVEQLDARIDEVDQQLASTRDELERLDEDRRAATASLEQADAAARAAEDAVEQARSESRRIERQLAAVQAELAENRAQLADFARDAYKYGAPATDPVLAAFEGLADADGPQAVADTLQMLDVVLGDRALVVEDSVRLLDETVALTDQARRVERRRLQEVAAAAAIRDRAATVHAEVLALIEDTDTAMRRQQRLLSELEAERSAAKGDADPVTGTGRPAGGGTGSTATTGRGAEGLVTVAGITVAASLAPGLEALLDAARADGIVLGGSGYRSPETTARLRLANGCPDVSNSPASACRIPTARPGTSLHERGLAIDFTYAGQTICYPRSPSACNDNRAFDWLAAKAATYGLTVNSAEAWHWSTTGD